MYVPDSIFSRRTDAAFAGAPVMVWVHGGAFLGGTGARAAYPPEAIMDAEEEEVVLVAINYRLGSLVAHSSFRASIVDGKRCTYYYCSMYCYL